MDWRPFDTLEETLIRSGSLPFERAIELIRATSQGLEALHQGGLCHGDLRPSHLLLEPDRGGFSQILLSDAGLAEPLQVPLSSRVDRRLPFTAPERLAGQKYQPQTDIYALGALSYLLLAGRLPFNPEDPRAQVAGADPVTRMSWLHLHARPHRPSQGMASPEFSPTLEALVGRALAKDPEQRPKNARQFRQEFEKALLSGDEDPSPYFADEQETAPPKLHLFRKDHNTQARRQRPLWLWWMAGSGLGILLAVLRYLL